MFVHVCFRDLFPPYLDFGSGGHTLRSVYAHRRSSLCLLQREPRNDKCALTCPLPMLCRSIDATSHSHSPYDYSRGYWQAFTRLSSEREFSLMMNDEQHHTTSDAHVSSSKSNHYRLHRLRTALRRRPPDIVAAARPALFCSAPLASSLGVTVPLPVPSDKLSSSGSAAPPSMSSLEDVPCRILLYRVLASATGHVRLRDGGTAVSRLTGQRLPSDSSCVI